MAEAREEIAWRMSKVINEWDRRQKIPPFFIAVDADGNVYHDTNADEQNIEYSKRVNAIMIDAKLLTADIYVIAISVFYVAGFVCLDGVERVGLIGFNEVRDRQFARLIFTPFSVDRNAFLYDQVVDTPHNAVLFPVVWDNL